MVKNENKRYAITAAVLLLASILPWPYGFYMLLKIAIMIIAIYYTWVINKLRIKKDAKFWILIAIAILYNPIIPIHLYSRALWVFVDIAAAIFFCFAKKIESR